MDARGRCRHDAENGSGEKRLVADDHEGTDDGDDGQNQVDSDDAPAPGHRDHADNSRGNEWRPSPYQVQAHKGYRQERARHVADYENDTHNELQEAGDETLNLNKIKWKIEHKLGANVLMHLGVRAMGLGGCSSPRIFQITKNLVILGKNHLIFVQANRTKYSGKRLQPPERNSSRTLMF